VNCTSDLGYYRPTCFYRVAIYVSSNYLITHFLCPWIWYWTSRCTNWRFWFTFRVPDSIFCPEVGYLHWPSSWFSSFHKSWLVPSFFFPSNSHNHCTVTFCVTYAVEKASLNKCCCCQSSGIADGDCNQGHKLRPHRFWAKLRVRYCLFVNIVTDPPCGFVLAFPWSPCAAV
jgi:hypothetical protein